MAYRTRPRFQAGVQRPRRDEPAQRPAARDSGEIRAARQPLVAAAAPRPDTRRPRWNTAPLLDALVELHHRQP